MLQHTICALGAVRSNRQEIHSEVSHVTSRGYVGRTATLRVWCQSVLHMQMHDDEDGYWVTVPVLG